MLMLYEPIRHPAAMPIGDCPSCSAGRDALSLDEAIATARAQARPIEEIESVPLGAAVGRILANDIHAGRAMPAFDASAMDGYAVNVAALAGDGPWRLTVLGVASAGARPARALDGGGAMRIYTGAPVPSGFDAVLPQEECQTDLRGVLVSRKPAVGENVRWRGEDCPRGALLAQAGTRIEPRHIGLFAAHGHGVVPVLRRPRVGIFSTGEELVDAGGELGEGRVFDANRPMLVALAEARGAAVTDLGMVGDDFDRTSRFIAALNGHFDLIVSSGAVSVGGRDFLRPAFERAGGRIASWGVAMKPGKPVMLGRLGTAAFTGLPGNPLSAYLGFQLFCAAQIDRLLGQEPSKPAESLATAGFDWRGQAGRTEFLPVRVRERDGTGRPVVERLGRGSASLLPLCQADGIAMIPDGCASLAAGDSIAWRPFDNGRQGVA